VKQEFQMKQPIGTKSSQFAQYKLFILQNESGRQGCTYTALFENEKFDSYAIWLHRQECVTALKIRMHISAVILLGFLNILEACKRYKIKHLVYASSSSVYGNSKKCRCQPPIR
jgi:UDP-glucuronate 4-epimerase